MRILCVATILTACVAQQPIPLSAVDDQLAVEMNTAAATAVLANDVGVVDKHTLAIVAQPVHGTATLGDDGTLQYVPAADYLGSDTLQYSVTDPDGAIATANVAITVGCATCAIGTTITLAWDANAPADMVQGYRLYLGAQNDTSMMTMADDIAITRPGFDPAAPTVGYDAWASFKLRIGAQACFAMTAYNAAGESGFSNVACSTVTHVAMRFGL